MLKKRLITLICVLSLAGVLTGCASPTPATTPTPAATPQPDPQADALAAYQKILEAAPALEGEHEELTDASFGYEQNLQKFGEHYDQFALTDLNQDGIPELISMTVVNFRWTPISVYTYADGKAVLLKDAPDAQSPVTFEQNSSANGAYEIYFCEENHIHSVWRGATPIGEMEEDQAYALEGLTLIVKDCPIGKSGNAVTFSDIAKVNSAENRNAMMQQWEIQPEADKMRNSASLQNDAQINRLHKGRCGTQLSAPSYYAFERPKLLTFRKY